MYSFDEQRGRWSLEPPAGSAGVADVYEAIWASSFAIVRGLPINCGACSHPPVDGVTSIYEPQTGAWRRTAPDPLRTDHLLSAWTGRALFSLNAGTSMQGASIDIEPGDATAYDPAGNAWTQLPLDDALRQPVDAGLDRSLDSVLLRGLRTNGSGIDRRARLLAAVGVPDTPPANPWRVYGAARS